MDSGAKYDVFSMDQIPRRKRGDWQQSQNQNQNQKDDN